MAEDIPVLDFFPSKFTRSGKYEKIKLGEPLTDAVDYHPFELVLTGSNKVKVNYGTVNSKVPDEVDVVLENGDEFDISDGDKFYINVELDMEHYQNVDEVEISKNPHDDNLDDKYSILLAEIDISGSEVTIAQVVTKNVSTVSCGIVHNYVVN